MKEPTERASKGAGGFKHETVKDDRRNGTGGSYSVAGIGGVSDIIDSVVGAGAYLSFGRTSDGGALIVRVLHGERKMTAYPSSREAFIEALHALQLEYPTASSRQGGGAASGALLRGAPRTDVD